MSDTNNIKPATGYVSTSLHEAVKLRIGKQGLAAIKPQTIPQYFREYVQKYEQYPALSYQPEVTLTANDVVKTPTAANAPQQQQQQQHKVQTTWQTLNYKQYLEQVEQTALMFMHVGLQPRSSVGVLAMNCPAWFYSELGALFAGGVATGIYPSSSAASVFHVLDTSEATVCVVDNSEQMAKVRSVKSRLPRLRAVIQLHGPYDDFVGIEDGYYSWQALNATNYGEKLREELARRERNVGANECALLIYTSGTTGMPKGVMLSHDAVVYGTESLTEAISSHSEMTTQERIVTFLPLNHIAGQLMDIYLSFRNGACVYFADRNALKSSLVKTLRYARPTRFFSVPRVFEKMQEQFMAMSTKSAGLTRFVLDTARQIMLRHHLDKFEGKNPSNVKHWLVEKVVRQVKAAFGLAEARTIMIGGAPSSTDLAHFFLSIDLPLVDCFGLSETGAINFNYDMHNIGTVGKVLDGTEEKIFNPDENGHGEICIRGRTCLMGYLHEMEKTKESLREDGWFHTGDIGYMNTAGELMVTGRIKELIITAGGENIPPQNIENFIKSELNALSNCILVGDHRKYLTVLLTLKTEIDPNTGYPLDALQAEAVEWLRSLNLNYTRLSEVLNIPADIHELDAASIEVKPDPKVLEAVEEGIKRANKHAISNAQRVQKFRFLPHDLSVPTGELGNTLKIRRNIILKKYANVIEQMYK